MLHDLRLGEEFFAALWALDAEIAGQVAAAGCAHCGGPLYQANYERKPRGGRIAVEGEVFTRRHSLCCGREGCRKRATLSREEPDVAEGRLLLEHAAERNVLWALEAQLERQLVTPFQGNYAEVVSEARARVEQSGGSW